MKVLKIGLIAILSLLAGWFTTSFFINKSDGNQNSNNSEVSVNSNSTELKHSNHLHNSVAPAPENAKSNLSLATNTNTSTSAADNDNQTHRSENIGKTEEIRKNSVPEIPFTATLAGAFTMETVDQKWAQESEPKLRDQFTVDGPLMGAEIKSVECKSSTCKITALISSDMETHLENVSRDIGFKIVTQQREFFDPNIMTVYSKQDKTLSIYISKISVPNSHDYSPPLKR